MLDFVRENFILTPKQFLWVFIGAIVFVVVVGGVRGVRDTKNITFFGLAPKTNYILTENNRLRVEVYTDQWTVPVCNTLSSDYVITYTNLNKNYRYGVLHPNHTSQYIEFYADQNKWIWTAGENNTHIDTPKNCERIAVMKKGNAGTHMISVELRKGYRSVSTTTYSTQKARSSSKAGSQSTNKSDLYDDIYPVYTGGKTKIQISNKTWSKPICSKNPSSHAVSFNSLNGNYTYKVLYASTLLYSLAYNETSKKWTWQERGKNTTAPTPLDCVRILVEAASGGKSHSAYAVLYKK